VPHAFFSDSIKNTKFGKEDASMDDVITAAKTQLYMKTSWALTNNNDTILGERGITLSSKNRGFP
jgi:ATP-binding cassette subfamily B protein